MSFTVAAVFATVALIMCTPASGQEVRIASTDLRRGDQHFLRDLLPRTEQNLAAAKLAQAQATDPQVRQFAAATVTSDESLQHELNEFAQAHGFTAGISERFRSKWTEELDGKTGADFDRKYMGRAIDSHEELLGALKDAADDAKDQTLRNIARRHVQEYKEIVDRAEKLKSSL